MKKENENIIELTDSEGKKVKYEILDVILRDDGEYAVFLPEGSEDEVVIFKMIPSDSDEVEYVEVTDDEIADEVFDEFIAKVDSEE